MDLLWQLADAVLNFMFIAILARVLFHWMGVNVENPLTVFLARTTDPILRPIRSILPRIFSLDLSPFVAISLIYILLEIVKQMRLTALST
jgi:YggT family protein